MNSTWRVAVCAIGGALIPHASAQPAKNAATGYPDKAVRWVVPFTPGASNDVIARLIALKLGEAWGQQFIIDNRPGAGGLIGADTVAKAAPTAIRCCCPIPVPT
jgi:tripartite-type tricarboxylate transporter receptor subunit TctC